MPEREKGPKKPPKTIRYGRPGEGEEPAPSEPEPAAPAPAERPRTPSKKLKAVTIPPEPPLSDFAKRSLEEVKRLLFTGITDWAVTNKDTEDIHAILEQLPRDEFLRIYRKLAIPTEHNECLVAKYLVRGVLDHSGMMQAKWSEQFDRKVYYEGGAYKSFDTLKAARDFEKEIAALVGAALWNQARLPPSQPLRGILAELRS